MVRDRTLRTVDDEQPGVGSVNGRLLSDQFFREGVIVLVNFRHTARPRSRPASLKIWGHWAGDSVHHDELACPQQRTKPIVHQGGRHGAGGKRPGFLFRGSAAERWVTHGEGCQPCGTGGQQPVTNPADAKRRIFARQSACFLVVFGPSEAGSILAGAECCSDKRRDLNITYRSPGRKKYF